MDTEMNRVFSRDEMASRVAKVQAAIEKLGVSALIVTRPQNIYYLSGFRAAHFAAQLSEFHTLVVPADGDPRLLTRALEKNIADQQWSASPKLHMDHESPYAALQNLFKENGIASDRIGIEERFLTLRQFNAIKRVFPNTLFKDGTELIEAVAVRSTRAEIDCLRRAAKITNIGFSAGIAAVRNGIYPYEIIGKIHEAMYAAGQSDFDMSMVCVWAGEHGGRMHDTQTTERIKTGDAVTIEIFGVDRQYKVGAQGTVFVGRKPSDEIQKNYRILSEMFTAARNSICSGVKSGDIYDAANKPYRRAWNADYFRKVGGSMGLTVFNIPLTKGGSAILEAGMCFLVQTLVDDPALITCSSTVLVTETGYETLTNPLLELQTV